MIRVDWLIDVLLAREREDYPRVGIVGFVVYNLFSWGRNGSHRVEQKF